MVTQHDLDTAMAGIRFQERTGFPATSLAGLTSTQKDLIRRIQIAGGQTFRLEDGVLVTSQPKIDILALEKEIASSPLGEGGFITQDQQIFKVSPPSPIQVRRRISTSLKQRAISPPVSLVSPALRPTGVRGFSQDLRNALSRLRTRRERGLPTSLRNEANILGLTALSVGANFVEGIIDLPKVTKEVIKNPAILKKIPSALREGGAKFGRIARISPGETLVVIGGNVLILKGTGKALNTFGKISEQGLARISPKFVGVAKTGSKLKIPVSKGKTITLKVVGSIPKEKLASQISRAGQRVDAISSQADRLLGVISRGKVIRKPIPKEATFNKATKRLLKRFDAGKINKPELLKLDSLIRKQGAKGILERAFFLDPTGKIRPSRLGVIREELAKRKKVVDVLTKKKRLQTRTERGIDNLIDLATEDITLKKAKPQILLFEKLKVAQFPKGFNTIKSKIARGVNLNKEELAKLLEFQLKRSSKAKPLGFISGESELLIAPGNLIKRVRKVGTTLVKGRRVPIITAKTFTPGKKIRSLLDRFKKGKLTTKQINRLDKRLKKITGFDYALSSSEKVGKRLVNLKKFGVTGLSKLRRRPRVEIKPLSRKKLSVKVKRRTLISPRKLRKKKLSVKARSKRPVSKRPISKKVVSKPISKPVSRKRAVSKPSPIRRVSRARPSPISLRRPLRPSPRPSRSPPKRPGSPPPKSPPPKKPPARPGPPVKPIKIRKRKKPKRKKRQEGFFIFEKRAGKFTKLKTKPLSRKDALDKLAHRLDNKISRTARIVKAGKVKRLGALRKNERGSFKRLKKNLRDFKIVKGKRVKLVNTFIEKKGRAVISTPGEKRQLLLNRLDKARKVRMANLKKKKKKR